MQSLAYCARRLQIKWRKTWRYVLSTKVITRKFLHKVTLEHDDGKRALHPALYYNYVLCLILKWKIQMKVRASEEDEVASDLENDSDPQGSSCSESIPENMRVKTKAKANSPKEKPRASTSKFQRGG